MIWLLAACAKVPDHLAVEPSASASAVDRRVATEAEAVALLAKRDPLVRSPLLPDAGSARALTAAPWLAAWLDATAASEQALSDPDPALEQLEQAWRGTPVVALTRGQRLRLAEGVLSRSEVLDEAGESQILAWLTPLRADEADVGLARLALDWLAPPETAGAAARHVGERWVLAGWLDGPAIPVGSIVAPLQSANYDPLRDAPLGALIVARGERRAADTAAAWTDLREATFLALNQAAADRDTEQRAWSDLRAAAASRLGADDPEAALLDRALKGLTAGAADDRAAGGALLAHGAARWHDTCTDRPCAGLDRVGQIAAAERWHPEVAELSRVWRVIALKEAIDTMDVAADTVGFPAAMVGLVDALDGTGAGPLSADLLRVRRGEPRTWAGIAAALGVEGVAEWTAARAALGRHLEQSTRSAQETCTDPTWVPLLERIARRAQP